MTDKSDKDVVTIDWKDGTYTGEVSDGVPHGRGEFVRAVEIVEEEYFRGSDDGCGEPDNVDNFGQIRLHDWYEEDKLFYSLEACAKYVGEFNSGQMEGEGTLTIVDGSTYVCLLYTSPSPRD